MKTWISRTIAITEAILVVFAVIPFLARGIDALFPGLATWQVDQLGFVFPVTIHVLMVVVPLILLLLTRRNLTFYGIHLKGLKYQLEIAGACFIPVVIASVPFGMGVDYLSWKGAILLAGIQIALLFTLSWILKKKPSATGLVVSGGGVLLPNLTGAGEPSVWKALAVFLTYALFVGFGEEVLYRGYLQSRLNDVFGHPYEFFGAKVGWGLVIASFLFGLTHVGVLRWITGLSTDVTWAWGFWTFFGGLVFGFVREKSGSVVAPALLHGLPQAIASVAMLFL